MATHQGNATALSVTRGTRPRGTDPISGKESSVPSRTLALAAAGVLTVCLTGPTGPAVAGSGAGVATQDGIILNEVATDLDPDSLEHDYTGDFVELANADSTGSVDVSGWELYGCNAAGDFKIATIPANTAPIPAGGRYLIGDDDFDAGFGPDRDLAFLSGADLEQSDGGVLLVDDSFSPQDDAMWGAPSQQLDCAVFTDVGVDPNDDESINHDDPWFLATPTPENSTS
jgi:hypothetical protein